MDNKNYSDLLKDPRWQKKRLKVMERDGFMCYSCKNKDDTLNVHHLNYRKNEKPWDYEDDELITLCEVCHGVISEYTNNSISIIRGRGFSMEVVMLCNDILLGLVELYPNQLKAVSNMIRIIGKLK